MQAQRLVQTINENYGPEDELIVLFWSKEEFEDSVPDAGEGVEQPELTDKVWKRIVKIMEDEGGLEGPDQEASEMIAEMVAEYSEPD